MGVSAGASKTSDKSSTDQNGNSDELMNSLTQANTSASNTGGFSNMGAGSTTATFAPEGQNMLSSLANRFSQPQSTTGRDTLNSLATGGGINPYVEGAISRSNDEATRQMQQAQAGIRAGGRGLGQNANMFGQADAASLFLSRLAGENANTRVGAFENAEGRRLGAASSAAGLEQGDTGLMANLIGLTRGQNTSQSSSGQTFQDLISQVLQQQEATANKKFENNEKSKSSSTTISAGIG